MTNRFKKNRKKRGHVSLSHSCIRKHRKHPGGHGNAGGMHHRQILFDKYHHGLYFEKVGIHYFHKLRNKFFCPTKVKVKASKDNARLIDVTQFQYLKVLGKGLLPVDRPIVVKTKLVSKSAEKKIKEIGGDVEITI
ncbi:60s ribosomal protein L15/L27 [Handroanthus impetiginosus]|uniref:60s ribosomal protein L15/L27 n=1 Tax=Handroanthus impetiginosus TaxID=429701 RepID=A0A2G9HE63_9LAMI|nr:60s ribosomal protein L15/L27 [Handroanthus impetiginosus]